MAKTIQVFAAVLITLCITIPFRDDSTRCAPLSGKSGERAPFVSYCTRLGVPCQSRESKKMGRSSGW